MHNDIFAPAGEPGVDGGHTSLSLAESVESYERNLIAAELRRHDGSVSRSARALRIARATLNDKIRKYGLSAA